MPKDERGEVIFYLFSAASAAYLLDRLTKLLAFSGLSDSQSITVIPNIFHITLVLNKGVAFGLLKDQKVLFISVSLLAILFIMVYASRHRAMGAILSSSLGLILGGAAGNLVDRIRFGYVIDFIDFRIWPVFNVADSCITIGTLLLAWRVLGIKANP